MNQLPSPWPTAASIQACKEDEAVTKKLMSVLMVTAMVLGLSAAVPVSAGDAPPCPWKITKATVGKWANGNKKAGVWIDGHFPIPPGMTERPDFYVNGQYVGKSQVHFQLRFIPNASSRLSPGANTITVQFTRPPYAGASNTLHINNFSWKEVPSGGYMDFR